MKRSHTIVLTLLLIVSGLFRLLWLNSHPIALFGDEIDVGYHARSLWETGRDYMGNFMPTYIQSFSEYRAPLLMYFVAPFVGIFGNNSLGVRLAPAIFGVLGVMSFIPLIKTLFPEKKYLTITAVVIAAFLPWHIHYSRVAFESTLLLLFVNLGFTALLKTDQKKTYFPLGLFLLSFTPYIYSTASLFVPLLFVTFLLLRKINFSKENIFNPLNIFSLIVVAPFFLSLFSGTSTNRFSLVSIINNPKIAESIIIKRTEPWMEGSALDRIFNNKATHTTKLFFDNYLRAFSPEFLALNGDGFSRHSTTNHGELGIVVYILFVLGFAYLINNLKDVNNRIILLWLLIAPIPAAITLGGGGHATRLFLMITPIVVTSTLGFDWVVSKFAKQSKILVTTIISALFLFEFVFFWFEYTTHYRFVSAKVWHYGYEQVFTKLKDFPSDKKLILNDVHEPALIRYAFFADVPPKEFQQKRKDYVIQKDLLEKFDGYKFGGNVYLGHLNEVLNKDELIRNLLTPGDVYFAVQLNEVDGNWNWQKEPPAGLKVVDMAPDQFGNPLFYLVTKQ